MSICEKFCAWRKYTKDMMQISVLSFWYIISSAYNIFNILASTKKIYRKIEYNIDIKNNNDNIQNNEIINYI